MARRYDSKEAKRRILTACVRLFLEKGYTNTKVAEILKEADVSAGSFQNIFHTKDGVLTELISMMFSRQFGAVRPGGKRPLAGVPLRSGNGFAAGADRTE
jgi:AcrR family transcriptional regulator